MPEQSPPAEPILFRTTLAVQISDINYGGHLANDAVLRLAHEARMRWLAEAGYNEREAGGAGLIMAEAHIDYHAQAFHGDVLDLTLAATEIGKAGFTLITNLTRRSDHQAIATVQCRMACFDYTRQRVTRMPAEFQTYLTSPQKG